MHKIKLILMISAHILFSFDLSAQTTNPNCKWVGNVFASFSNPNIPQRNELLIGNVVFEYDRGEFFNGEVYEVYKLTGGRMTWSVAGGGPPDGCIVKSNSISFSWDSVQIINGELNIYEGGRYNGGAANQDLSYNFNAVHTDCENYSADEPPLVTGVTIGNQEDTSFIQDDVMSGSFTQGFTTWSWNLHKESGEEVQMQIESNTYDNWLPSAGKNEEEYGEGLVFEAKLIEPDGSTACLKAKKFVFQLIDVSKEPGVALNFPEVSKAKDDFDIHFIAELNSPTDIMSPDRLSLETKGGSQAMAVVLPFDWGAYATLKVTAYMQNDDTLTGFLSGHPEITEIPIPKRSGNSKIADKWKEDNGVTSISDNDDAENLPKGDNDNGDGFTLYEEYRGFYEKGSHIFGDPKKKDLFIFSSSEKYFPGILYFKALTSLNIHYRLNSTEFDTVKKLINFNHANAPHETEQHGLFITATSDTTKSYSIGYGPPKNVISVNISVRATEETHLISTIAHELGHAVGIHHHGPDIDKNTTWATFIIGDTLIFLEDGFTVDARWEYPDKPYSQIISGVGWVGHQGGQHSGFSDCIMRYHVAFAYIPESGGNIRYITGGNEGPGLFLCDTKLDKPLGFNYRGRRPRPRYGYAANGNCQSQICVNDKYH